MLLLLAAIYNAILPRAVISNMQLNRLSDTACRYCKTLLLYPTLPKTAKLAPACDVLLAPYSTKWTSEARDYWLILKSASGFAMKYKIYNCNICKSNNNNQNNNAYFYTNDVPSKKKVS